MSTFDAVVERYQTLQTLNAAISLMNWDRQVLMPPGGAEARSAQVGRLTMMAHQILVSEKTQRLVENLESEAAPGSDEAATARVMRRSLDTELKRHAELVERKSRVSSDGYEAWKKAKSDSNFSILAPFLEQLFDIARETAELFGYTNHIYDPLIDQFEEGATFATADGMFKTIKQPIIDLVREIRENGTPVDDSAIAKSWDTARLRDFAQKTATKIGYDFDRGRLDVAPNAFCTGMSTDDVRMTTRASDHIKGILSSSLHEMGHGLYEQGSPAAWDRTPLAGGISLAVHESQSRLWENIIGRSHAFWQHFLPSLQEAFPELSGLTSEQFYKAYSKVEPSYIRVGADELTYNLHILIRFEMECEILTRQIAIKDMPEAWNAKYQEYLGITPPNDALGVLQDVHWSRGSIGYFPTYAMGNLIGGQIWQKLQGDIGDADPLMAAGNFAPILGWLTDKLYSQGKRHKPDALVERVTGNKMRADEWLAYADAKYRAIYNIKN